MYIYIKTTVFYYSLIPLRSSETVVKMSVDRRKCLTRNEDLTGSDVIMEAFQDYSRPSCLLECRARLLRDECKCLPYYYPDFSSSWKMNTTCDLDGLKCIGGKASEFLSICK